MFCFYFDIPSLCIGTWIQEYLVLFIELCEKWIIHWKPDWIGKSNIPVFIWDLYEFVLFPFLYRIGPICCKYSLKHSIGSGCFATGCIAFGLGALQYYEVFY